MRSYIPWIPTIITFAPLLGLLILACIPKRYVLAQRLTTIIATLPSLFLTIYLYTIFDPNARGFQFIKSVFWFQFSADVEKNWTFYYHMGVDGISMPLVLMTSLIATLTAFASFFIHKRTKEFYTLFLVLLTGMLGVFFATNLLLFFIFFEVTLIVMFFLIGVWGYMHRERAANMFLLYNGLGSGFLLYAVIALLFLFGSLEFPVLREQIGVEFQRDPFFMWSIFIALLIAFAIKLPMFPFHTWMLRVHVEASPAVVMIHAGILLKMGAYGLIRFGLGWFPVQMREVALLLIILGLINLFYGAILAFVQKELKRVLAYSSISHMGILLLGIASLQTVGVQGAMFQAVSHGFIASLFFLLVAILYERTHTTELNELGGLAKTMPLFSGVLLFTALASLGLPGLSGFISEFLAFLGLFKEHAILTAIASLGLIFAAAYALRATMKITFGPLRERFVQLADLRWQEGVPIAVFVLLIIALGIVPDWLGKPMQSTLHMLIERIGG